jgi:hypothetical protein
MCVLSPWRMQAGVGVWVWIDACIGGTQVQPDSLWLIAGVCLVSSMAACRAHGGMQR